MTEEVAIVDRVTVDIEELPRQISRHVAATPSEPLEALFKNKKRGSLRAVPVHAFNASGDALVLSPDGPSLTVVSLARKPDEEFVEIRRSIPRDPVKGPFTPAPPGLFAVLYDGQRLPIRYYDSYGRPVVSEDDTHELYLAKDDEALVEITRDPESTTPSIAEVIAQALDQHRGGMYDLIEALNAHADHVRRTLGDR